MKEIDKILPLGIEPDLSLSWFALTDGDLWLKFGAATIYEYSKEAQSYLDNKPSQYNHYYLTRFVEDFSELFEAISETIPEEFYYLTQDIKKFQVDIDKWFGQCGSECEEHNDLFVQEYMNLISWTSARRLSSSHLIGGPELFFFRRKERLKIVWHTEYILDNGISLWEAKDGSCEMDYSDFVGKIKLFGQTFFEEMEKQIKLAIAKEWGSIKIDKEQLINEQKERKKEFIAALSLLEKEPTHITNWTETAQLFNRMKSEIQ